MPILVVWGDHDGIIPTGMAQQVAARLPGASLEIIQDAAHDREGDQPDACAPIITRFLAAHQLEAARPTAR